MIVAAALLAVASPGPDAAPVRAALAQAEHAIAAVQRCEAADERGLELLWAAFHDISGEARGIFGPADIPLDLSDGRTAAAGAGTRRFERKPTRG
jgi:hypothetical protein